MIDSPRTIHEHVKAAEIALEIVRSGQEKAAKARIKIERDPANKVEVDGLLLAQTALDEAVEWLEQYRDMLDFGRECWEAARKEFDTSSHKEEK